MKLSRGEWLLLLTGANLLFVTPDILVAHSYNSFAARWEYVPLIVCPVAGGSCLAAIRFPGARPWARAILTAVIGMGVLGFILHLNSRFLTNPALRTLVYSAPVAAPLVFCGLGLTGLVAMDFERWGGWMPLLLSGGFAGNFSLAVLDHAQNGFFHALEWVSVVVAGLAMIYYALLFWKGSPTRPDRQAALGIAGVVFLTGLVGAAAHVAGILQTPGGSLVEQVISGPPAFAPLLFADLALFAVILYA